jgi:putative redox protein
MTFIGQNKAGGTVQMGTLDGRPGVGPMQLLLVGLAGCTGVDIVGILQKKRINFTDMQVKVRAKRASDYPMIWTDIHVTYLVWGEEIRPKDVEQDALHDAAERRQIARQIVEPAGMFARISHPTGVRVEFQNRISHQGLLSDRARWFPGTCRRACSFRLLVRIVYTLPQGESQAAI